MWIECLNVVYVYCAVLSACIHVPHIYAQTRAPMKPTSKCFHCYDSLVDRCALLFCFSAAAQQAKLI